MSALRHPQPSKVFAPVADAAHFDIGISDAIDELGVLSSILDDGFFHICQKEGHRFEAELNSARTLMQSNQEFFERPLEFALGTEALVEYRYEYNSSTIKSALIEGLSAFLKKCRAGQALTTSVLNCADEIYTNSIYNAPFINLYSQFNPGVGRDRTSVFLADQYRIEMTAARYEDRVALVCRDPFGSLDIEMFLSRIKNTHEVGPGRALNFGAGGSGLGSYIIFKECSSLYIAAKPGVATMVVCVFPIGMSGLQRENLVKHLHWVRG